MDLPKAPDDMELRNIIDKLAQFVARNGPEFEQMTKNKQSGNPKFYFLFGGEYYHYYQYRVSSERSMINGGSNLPPQPATPQSGPPPHAPHHLNNAFYSQAPQHQQPRPQSHQLPPQMFSRPPLLPHQFPPRFPPPQSNSQNGQFGHPQMGQQPPAIPHGGLYSNSATNEPFVPPSSSASSSLGQPLPVPLRPPPPSNLATAPQPSQFNAWPTPPHAYQSQAMNQTHPVISDNFSNNNTASNTTDLKPNDFSSNSNSESIDNNSNTSEIQSQIKELRDQITDSETNLSLQHKVITEDDLEKRIEELIKKLLDDELKRMCEDFDINLNEFDKILQPIIETCRKESIANGKVWIFNNCYINEHYEAVAKHLLKRVTRMDSSFEAKLHLMYLINDLYNHCMRKGDDRLKDAINQIIVPSFSNALLEASDDKKQKMNKLLKLWEMNQYLDNSLLDQLKAPEESLDAYKTSLHDRFKEQIKTVTDEQIEKYNKLELQHKEFAQHQETKIEQLLHQEKQTQQQSFNTLNAQPPLFPPNANLFHGAPPHMAPGQMPPLPPHLQLFPPQSSNPSQLPSLPPSLPSTHQFAPQSVPNQPHLAPYSSSEGVPISPQLNSHILPNFYQNAAPGQVPPGMAPFPSSGGGLPPPMHYGQLTAPSTNSASGSLPGMPPTFPPTHPSQYQPPPLPNNEEVKIPYFDLPAGIMTQLIKLEDFDYNPINPKDIRMPPITPPSERLLQAIEAFYAPPSHEHPRNAEGWEKLGLYEFFKAKSQSRKEYESKSQSDDNFKEDNDESNDVNNSNSSTFSVRTADDGGSRTTTADAQTIKSIEKRSPSPPKRRYKEFKEESPGITTSKTAAEVTAAPIQRRRSRSRSGSGSHDRRNKSSRHSRSKSRSRSRSRSPGLYKPPRNRSRSRSPSYSRKSSRSKRRSRSISPHKINSSYSLTSAPVSQVDLRLSESNKGHQLLKKMGWSGSTGLGANEQGLQEPIPSGDVREKSEQFHGIGIAPSGMRRTDPFESFRRNKGQAYIQRIRDGRRD